MAVQEFIILHILHVDDRLDFIIGWNLDEVLDGATLANSVPFWNLIDIEPETSSFFSKEQQRMMRTRYKKMFYIIFQARLASAQTSSSPALLAVFGGRRALDITIV